MGSGFTLKTGDDATLNLVMLYTTSQSQREQQTAAERAQRNRLMTASQQAVDELQPAIKELCRTLDGLVYVVDATVPAEDSERDGLFFTKWKLKLRNDEFLRFRGKLKFAQCCWLPAYRSD